MSNGRFVAAISRAEGWTFGLFEATLQKHVCSILWGLNLPKTPEKYNKKDANEKLYLRQLGKPFDLKIRIMLR